MGYARPRPQHLSAKLLQIRRTLKLSQPQLAKRLGILNYTDISKYELNRNEPSLMTLLAYSRLSGVRIEVIIDDDLNLEF
ncbi:MAG TPA: helix-turn-helix transcriptional regulator [Pyrinomonadaceae bacterium]|nr:helix-turn-helix transcriptional regulator [Pyrinomonadaceae bacterium]